MSSFAFVGNLAVAGDRLLSTSLSIGKGSPQEPVISASAHLRANPAVQGTLRDKASRSVP